MRPAIGWRHGYWGCAPPRVSLLPEFTAGNQLRLGYVEVEHSDPFRASLIGLAPTVSGLGLTIIGLAFGKLGADHLLSGLACPAYRGIWQGWQDFLQTPDLAFGCIC
jgi:hypothetical protein